MIAPESTIEYTTYSAFKTAVRRVVFPEGAGESMAFAHDLYFKNALSKLQMFIECWRANQVDFFYKDQAFDHCGMSLIHGPSRAKIKAVYAFKPTASCEKFFYNHKTAQFLSCWAAEDGCRWVNPDTTVYSSGGAVCYPYFATETEEPDDNFKCASRFFSVQEEGKIYLAPRFPCGYIVAVHWEGLRTNWRDNDAIPDDSGIQNYVALSIQAEVALRNDKNAAHARDLRQESENAFADLAYWCNEHRRVQADRDCSQGLDAGQLSMMFPPVYPHPSTDLAEGATLNAFDPDAFGFGFG